MSVMDRKLGGISLRARIASIARRSYLCLLALSAAYLAALLLSRLTGLIPDYFSPWAILIPPALALMAGTALHRRYLRRDLARMADARMGTKDLFYTSVMLDSSYGDYRPLLMEKAEEEAARISPEKIIEYRFAREAAVSATVLGLLLALSIFLPQLDPFGKKLAEKKRREENALLKKMDEDVRKRLEILRKSPAAANSPEVARTIEEIKNTFGKLNPGDRKANSEKLMEMQKNLNGLLKDANERKLQDMLGKKFSTQTFGRGNENIEKLRKEIKNGDFSGTRKELRDLADLARKMAGMEDSTEKRKMAEDAAKKIKELAELNRTEIGSKSLQMALDTAMKELGMTEDMEAAKEALSSMANSSELGERELQRLEELMNDMKALESASRAAQLAKMLNELQALQNASGEGFQEMIDYQKFYEQLMEMQSGQPGDQPGQGIGDGTGGQGIGKGGKVPENDSIATDSKSELSKSKIVPGKTLMEWKTRQITDPGMVREEYVESLREVKQGVSEAIVKEQVPPGYHDAIRNYFGSMGSEKETAPSEEKK